MSNPTDSAARWLERARQTQCCDAAINGLLGEAIEIVQALTHPADSGSGEVDAETETVGKSLVSALEWMATHKLYFTFHDSETCRKAAAFIKARIAARRDGGGS